MSQFKSFVWKRGFSVLGFTLDCTKNKDLKWSENILPKTKKGKKNTKRKKENAVAVKKIMLLKELKKDHFKKTKNFLFT